MSKKRQKSIEALEESFLGALEGKLPGTSGDDTGAKADGAPAGGTVTVGVSPDGMRAVLRASDAEPLSAQQIVKLLRRHRVVYGIDQGAVAQAVEQLKTAGGWPGELPVARGTPVEQPWELAYPFLEPSGSLDEGGVWLVDGVPLFSNLAQVFAANSRDEINGHTNVAVKAVQPETVIVRIVKTRAGTPGRNVYGEAIKVGEFPLHIGDNIQFDETAGEYRATIYGYLHADGRQLAVLPPIWMQPDRMAAYFVSFAQVGPPSQPSEEQLLAQLAAMKIKPGCLRRQTIGKVCAALKKGEKLPITVKIASGFEPKPGRDAVCIYHFDSEVKAGRLREDDSLDLRERNLVVAVAEGELLAEKILPTKGTMGSTLLGEKLPAPDGKDVECKIGDGVRQEREDRRICYYAAINGNVVLKKGVLSVAEVFTLHGDVDYKSGNIRVKSDLTVAGSVCPGFSVHADGNITIKGMIETGTSVTAGGNLTVVKGIIGEETKVVAMGDLVARFIQDAQVMAGGNVILDSYLYNGMVRAGGMVSVQKGAGAKSGKVVGGVVCASKGMEVSVVGSPSVRNTLLALQPSPERLTLLRQVESRIEECSVAIQKIMRTAGLESVDAVSIRVKLETVAPQKRELFTKLLVNLSALIKQRGQFEADRKALQEEVERDLAKAAIRVTSTFYQGNTVQIGEKKFVPPTDLGPSVFQLINGKIAV